MMLSQGLPLRHATTQCSATCSGIKEWKRSEYRHLFTVVEGALLPREGSLLIPAFPIRCRVQRAWDKPRPSLVGVEADGVLGRCVWFPVELLLNQLRPIEVFAQLLPCDV